MRHKRPKLHVEMNPVLHYPQLREEMKKELEKEFPNNPETVAHNLMLADELHKIEVNMYELQGILDQKIEAAENNALQFLGCHPERIPHYIQRLTADYNRWKQK